VKSRFGTHAPALSIAIKAIAEQKGETVVSHGAAAAYALGLTTQVPVREIYLTSGRTRRLKFGAQTVELRYAPSWQLVLPNRLAGEAVRALGWIGPKGSTEAIRILGRRLPKAELREIATVRGRLPAWMAQEIRAF